MRKSTVSSRFSEKSGTYDQYALVQRQMAERLQTLVCAAVTPERVGQLLEIGCGTGGLTKLLGGRFSAAHYQALDLAPGMLAEAERKLGQEGLDCTFIQADVEEWVWEQEARSQDMIVSGACFQWLSRPEETIKGLARLLRPDGALLFSTFGPETFAELHASFSYAHVRLGQTELRHGLSFHSAEQWRSMLLAAGFGNVAVSTEKAVLYYPSVKDFLHAVKAVGANTAESQPAGLGSRRLLLEMMRYYEHTYGSGRGIPVTYDLLYIQAKKSRILQKNMES